MKEKIVFALMLLSGVCYGQPSTHLQISGRKILGTCGDTIILKGINYAPYNWGYSANENYFDQIALTKANCVRMVWYKNSGSAIYNNLVYLDSALTRCIRAKMIPILELHDATCTGNMADVTALIPFFTSAAFKALELKYRQHLIINIANEAGNYAWASNPANALNSYKTAYKNAVTTLRTNGLQVPIMIDAPDCGTNSDAIVNAGAEILASDALSNTMFSVHGYWYGFAGNNPATMNTKVQALYNTGLCVYFGEVANQQDDANPCQYNLAYLQLLGILHSFKIGWTAWGWFNDVCPLRQISNNGDAGNLSAYGQVIVNDANYGLKATAIEPLQFKTNCGNTCELKPGEISGPGNACIYMGTNIPATYSILPAANAISYKWTLPANTTLLSAASNSLSITILFNANFSTGTDAQKMIKISAMSACGNSTDKYLSIFTSKPTKPLFLNGSSNICMGMLPDVVTYTTQKVANATGYLWTIPPVGATIVGHPAGIGMNDTVITVQFNNLFPITPNPAVDFIGVAATSACGTSLQKKLILSRKAPSSAGTISGITDICSEMQGSINPTGNTVIYSIKKIPNASSYFWSVPLTGVSMLAHPGGAGVNDTIIHVQYNPEFPAAGGQISVKGINGCFEGIEKVITIKTVLPAIPGIISGTSNPCTNITNGTDAIYSIRKIALATGYNWTTLNKTTGGSGSITITGHPGGTGVNDTIVLVHYNTGFITGTINVQSVRNCGISGTRSLTVTSLRAALPGPISGSATPCIGATEVYNCPEVQNATAYNWMVPINAKILGGQGTNQLTVLYPETDLLFKPGKISVTAISLCGNSITQTLAITKCIQLLSSLEQNESGVVEAGISVNPNPINGNFIISLNNWQYQGNADIKMFDAAGKLVFAKSLRNPGYNLKIAVTTKFPAGIYFIHLVSANHQVIKRIICTNY